MNERTVSAWLEANGFRRTARTRFEFRSERGLIRAALDRRFVSFFSPEDPRGRISLYLSRTSAVGLGEALARVMAAAATSTLFRTGPKLSPSHVRTVEGIFA